MFYDPYDKNTQVKFLRADPTGRSNPLQDEDTAEEAMHQAFVAAIIVGALCLIGAGFIAGLIVGNYERDKIEYRDKVDFCHDRMKNDDVKSEWRQMYCRKSDWR